VKLAFQLAQSGFNEKLAARISAATMLASEAGTEHIKNPEEEANS
jgi:hypothetical protein